MTEYTSVSCSPSVRELLDSLKEDGWTYNDLLVEMAHAYDPNATEDWVEEPIDND